jgi:hypothetical protein
MRLAVPLVLLALAALPAGCGSSSEETGGARTGTVTSEAPAGSGGDGGSGPSAPIGASARSCPIHTPGAEALRATGISCNQARQVVSGWQRRGSCSSPAGASRTSCLTRSYRCLGARTDRGLAVSCSRAGESIGFIVRRG